MGAQADLNLGTPCSESLLRLPPSLETLLAEKRFLSAVVLLVRCNKALKKPDLLEVGALADLRAWALAQEGVSWPRRLSPGSSLLIAHRSRRCRSSSTS